MLVVLLIISVLLLLFVPNLTKQKDSVKETGNAAVVKVVESQAELYELNHTNDQATPAKLIADGNIPTKQAESYHAYYAKNSGENTCGCRLRPSPWWETLLTLMIVSFIYLGLSGSIKTSFQQVEEKIFLRSLNTSIKKARS